MGNSHVKESESVIKSLRETALIVSLKAHPGHVSHLLASYKQCDEIGYEPYLYVAEGFKDFIPSSFNTIYDDSSKIRNVGLVIFLFPNPRNLLLLSRVKRQNKGIKVVYLFHEPLTNLDTYRKSGFTTIQMIKLVLVDVLERITVKTSDLVLLPSKRALDYYESNKHYKNPNYSIIPLLYDDESQLVYSQPERLYFSYIGTIASDHSYNEFVNFMLWAVENDRIPELSFLIATRNTVERTPRIEKAIQSGRLKVVDGKPMTNEEINHWYASSVAIWNAYARTTQSGVLPKAFMFGTPAVVLRSNLTEYAHDKKEVVCVDENTNKEDLLKAVETIQSSFLTFSSNCRNCFLSNYYYRAHNEEFRELIEKA